MGGAAWKVAVGDQLIGWSVARRVKALGLVVNQQRFLILPWVKVPHCPRIYWPWQCVVVPHGVRFSPNNLGWERPACFHASMLQWIRERRRRRLRLTPFPAAWRGMLLESFPLFARLSAADQRELEGHIQVFLAEKTFEGCGGLVLTDEMKVMIAAQACLLLLHRRTDYYPGLRSIVVYPGSYSVETSHYSDHGVVTEGRASRLGESWQHGAVVLAWDAAWHGARSADGQNVVLHEFAHQLDQEDGRADGAPILTRSLLRGRADRYRAWTRVFSCEFERLQREVSANIRTLMDAYGATDPAEFFAVATECFFEKPDEMLKQHPNLYAELQSFYQQDPAQWK